MVWTIMGSWNYQQKCWSGVGCLKRAKNKYVVSSFVMRSNTPYHFFLLNHDSHQKPRVGRRWIYSFVGHINQRVWHQGKYGSQPAKMDPIWWVRAPAWRTKISRGLSRFFSVHYEVMNFWWLLTKCFVESSLKCYFLLVICCDMLWYIVIYCDILQTTVHR